MFLSGIAVSLDLQPDAPALDQCGSCTLCIDSCPTGAIVDAREVDATRCISYLTIETEGEIPEAQRALIGQHAWGCDICQDVCPFNFAAAITTDPAWQGPQRDGRSAAALWEQSDDELHAMIKGSAMTYVPLSRLRRNLATIIGNSGDHVAVAAARSTGTRRQECRALDRGPRRSRTRSPGRSSGWGADMILRMTKTALGARCPRLRARRRRARGPGSGRRPAGADRPRQVARVAHPVRAAARREDRALRIGLREDHVHRGLRRRARSCVRRGERRLLHRALRRAREARDAEDRSPDSRPSR